MTKLPGRNYQYNGHDIWFGYGIENINNGKVYFGITTNPAQRWANHKYNAKTLAKLIPLYNAMHAEGAENFKFEIDRDSMTKAQAWIWEEAMIKRMRSQDPQRGYNVQPGGQVSF